MESELRAHPNVGATRQDTGDLPLTASEARGESRYQRLTLASQTQKGELRGPEAVANGGAVRHTEKELRAGESAVSPALRAVACWRCSGREACLVRSRAAEAAASAVRPAAKTKVLASGPLPLRGRCG